MAMEWRQALLFWVAVLAWNEEIRNPNVDMSLIPASFAVIGLQRVFSLGINQIIKKYDNS
jgi:hypothetical protein